jgi:hypothetical protein
MLLHLSHVFAKAVLAAAAVVNAATAIAACNIINGKAYGDCAGVTVNQGTKPPLQIRGVRAESGIVAGATVFGGGSLHLSGISNGDITIQKDGRLILTGVVNGTVRNLGGTAEIEGALDFLFTTGGKVVVAGTVGSVAGPGAVTFRRGSVLGGTPFESETQRSGNP